MKELIRDFVSRFEKRLGENIKQDSKSFYKYVKSKQRVKNGIGPSREQSGEVSSDSKFMTEELNNFLLHLSPEKILIVSKSPIYTFNETVTRN